MNMFRILTVNDYLNCLHTFSLKIWVTYGLLGTYSMILEKKNDLSFISLKINARSIRCEYVSLTLRINFKIKKFSKVKF